MSGRRRSYPEGFAWRCFPGPGDFFQPGRLDPHQWPMPKHDTRDQQAIAAVECPRCQALAGHSCFYRGKPTPTLNGHPFCHLARHAVWLAWKKQRYPAARRHFRAFEIALERLGGRLVTEGRAMTFSELLREAAKELAAKQERLKREIAATSKRKERMGR